MINIFIVFRLPLSVSLLFLIPFAFVRVCLSDSAPSTTSQFGGKHFFFSLSGLFQFHLMWLRAIDSSQNFIRFSHPFGFGPLFSASPCVHCLRFDRCANGVCMCASFRPVVSNKCLISIQSELTCNVRKLTECASTNPFTFGWFSH